MRVEAFRNDGSKHIPRDCNRGVSRLISEPATLGFSGRLGSARSTVGDRVLVPEDIRGRIFFFLLPSPPSLHFYGLQRRRSVYVRAYVRVYVPRECSFLLSTRRRLRSTRASALCGMLIGLRVGLRLDSFL